MLKALLRREIGKMERAWNYDASYLRHAARVSPASILKFGLAAQMVDASAAPAAARAAAKLAGTLTEDCGPCVQITVDMALDEGVEPQVLHAILAGDTGEMGEDAALAWRFAQASLARDMEACDPLREEIVARWGDRGLVALGLTLITARMYPTLKYAMGYGRSCSMVTVAGVAVAPAARGGRRAA